MNNFVFKIGMATIVSFKQIKEIFSISFKVFLNVLCFRLYLSQLVRNMVEIGFFSLFVLFLTAFFTGAVLTLQTYDGLSFFVTTDSLANVVVSSITRELAPVLTGLMIAGRISSSIAAEISTMKQTEQVDALRTLAINPIKYLLVPQIVAGTLMVPLLLIIANVVGMYGSFVVATMKFNFVSELYISSIVDNIVELDILMGITKAIVFGFILTFVGSMYGYLSSGGSRGVGKATTMAVVMSSVLILCSNYIITFIFML